VLSIHAIHPQAAGCLQKTERCPYVLFRHFACGSQPQPNSTKRRRIMSQAFRMTLEDMRGKSLQFI
jgi:hypothetical protein